MASILTRGGWAMLALALSGCTGGDPEASEDEQAREMARLMATSEPNAGGGEAGRREARGS